MKTGSVKGLPLILLKLEGAAVLIFACVFYAHAGNSWWLFALLILLPDITMLGYFINSRIGAHIYNSGHTYIVPSIVGILGYLLASPLCISVFLIWIAHIGFDRMLGYGLKYEIRFGDTHLGIIGRAYDKIEE